MYTYTCVILHSNPMSNNPINYTINTNPIPIT